MIGLLQLAHAADLGLDAEGIEGIDEFFTVYALLLDKIDDLVFFVELQMADMDGFKYCPVYRVDLAHRFERVVQLLLRDERFAESDRHLLEDNLVALFLKLVSMRGLSSGLLEVIVTLPRLVGTQVLKEIRKAENGSGLVILKRPGLIVAAL